MLQREGFFLDLIKTDGSLCQGLLARQHFTAVHLLEVRRERGERRERKRNAESAEGKETVCQGQREGRRRETQCWQGPQKEESSHKSEI